ncbi:LysR family transcriptional regulator [Vibrio sinaloensis]|uniref:LysR family transcriptional regulator n=1 Tax=Photobacterium sp. (strain ATCC 43367) TaxID=379097 RepID=UPI00204F7720|nr:LysR family transcriptional regulator [Vibrio sinaloensis]UPQ86927.1 LysR family transcriptional regulator [Vibrio sinaloensis]
MNISIDQATAFVHSADELSFKRAAQILNKHPSTVADLVKNLELELGLELFTRSVRKLALTKAGHELYDYTLTLVEDKYRLENKAKSLLNNTKGSLTIACDNSIKSLPLAQAIQPLYNNKEILDFSILTGEPIDVVNWVINGRADLALSVAGSTNSFTKTIIQNVLIFDIVNVMSINHKQFKKDMTRRELHRITQISYASLKDSADEKWHNLSREIIFTNDRDTLLQMVELGMGWARIPSFTFATLDNDCIAKISINGLVAEPWTIDSIILPSHQNESNINKFLANLKSEYARIMQSIGAN